MLTPKSSAKSLHVKLVNTHHGMGESLLSRTINDYNNQSEFLNSHVQNEESNDQEEPSDQSNNQNSVDSYSQKSQARFVSSRPDYITSPTLPDILQSWDPVSKTLMVNDFTVTRIGFGGIKFPGKTDLSGLNLDEIVFIQHKEVEVYPDESVKPVQGTVRSKLFIKKLSRNIKTKLKNCRIFLTQIFKRTVVD